MNASQRCVAQHDICLFLFFSLGKICDMCDVNAECINNHCVCKQNYIGNGFHCTGDYFYTFRLLLAWFCI